MHRSRNVVLALVIGMVFAGACSSKSSSPAAPDVQSSSVGVMGGSVRDSDGSYVTIPPGALASQVTITMSSETAPSPAGATVVGPAYVLGPEGQQFAQPVTVTLAISPQQLPPGKTAADVVILTAAAGSTAFTSLGGSAVDATHIQAVTTHFSQFVPAVPQGQAVASGSSTVNCNGSCVDVQIDSANCGMCGHACANGQGCAAGACTQSCGGGASGSCGTVGGVSGSTLSCGSGGTPCPCGDGSGATCTDLQTDSQNCGACGMACSSGQVCQGASCVAECPSGTTCLAGFCLASCPSGTVNCNGSCIDVQIDSANCGMCGHACANGQGCAAGTCTQSCGGGASGSCGTVGGVSGSTLSCGSGGTPCPCGDGSGATCTDLQTDSQNCGACGMACSSGQVCQGASCVAECPSGTTCLAGFCLASCPSGTVNCNGSCVDVQTDSANCGICGHACANGQGCAAGTCTQSCGGNLVGCGSAGNVSCGSGETLCPCGGGSVCTDVQTDPLNCGACGMACSSGQVCQGASCVAECPSGTTCLAGFCRTNCP